jgi:hypothetical protein
MTGRRGPATGEFGRAVQSLLPPGQNENREQSLSGGDRRALSIRSGADSVGCPLGEVKHDVYTQRFIE